VTPNAAQHLLVYYPRPGTDAKERLELLRVIGTQTMTDETDSGSTVFDRG
jgi:hypothetical protein